MAKLDAKEQFQTFQSDSCKELSTQVQQRWFQTSLTFAFAQLASSASSDEMSGARKFISVLSDLATAQIEKPVFPAKRLDMDGPQEVPVKVKEESKK